MTKALRRLISGLEVIGGVFGIFILARQLIGSRVDLYVLLLGPIAIGIFLMSVVAGVLLWREHRAGRMASIIVQTIQLPKVVSPPLIFSFSFGLDLYPYIQVAGGAVSKMGVDFKLLAFYNLYLNSPGAPVAVGFSIPAAAFLIMLLRYKPGGTRETMMPPPPPTSSEWNHSTDSDTTNAHTVATTISTRTSMY